MKRRYLLQSLAATPAALFALATLGGCGENKPAFNAVDITGADYARDFALADHNGQLRHLSDFAGKVVLVFFGYTQCPDVCPTTMSDLAEVKKQLGADGARLQVLFVTVDPERDTPSVLKNYMVNFDPTFLALCPTPAQLVDVARDFKVYYKKVEGSAPGSYSMDHSAGSYIYDPQGHVRLFARFGGGVAPMVQDLKQLLV